MRFIAIIALSLLSTVVASASVNWSAYKPKGYVNDFSGVFADTTINKLDTFVRQVNSHYNVKLAAVVLPSLRGESGAEVAEFFYDYWSLERDNSAAVLVLVSPEDNAASLYIGDGLLAVLDESWERSYNSAVATKLGNGDARSALVVALKSIATQIHDHSGDIMVAASASMDSGEGHSFGAKHRGFGAAKKDPGGNKVGGLPIVAIVAGGFGGFLLLSTMLKAGQHHKSFYDYGDGGFERGRTGPFGNKKPNWQSRKR